MLFPIKFALTLRIKPRSGDIMEKYYCPWCRIVGYWFSILLEDHMKRCSARPWFRILSNDD